MTEITCIGSIFSVSLAYRMAQSLAYLLLAAWLNRFNSHCSVYHYDNILRYMCYTHIMVYNSTHVCPYITQL